MVLWKEFSYHKHKHIHYPVKVANYFRTKISILDAWQGPKYAFERRMKIAKENNSVSTFRFFV